MLKPTPLLGLMSCCLLLMTACSQPLPKLAYPDGSHRIPINPPWTSAQKAHDATESSASAASGAGT
jgi:hypothetical protein